MPKMPSSKSIRGSFVVLGIDPGKQGGLVMVSQDGLLLASVSMPETEENVLSLIQSYKNAIRETSANAARVVCAIEAVSSMPGNSARSMFTFGMGYGGLRMALLACGIPFQEVRPQTWMKALNIPNKKKTMTKGEWKNFLKSKAQQLFPGCELTNATADAALIAEYGRRVFR